MTKPKIYLAGPVTGLTKSVADGWRSAVLSELERYDMVGIDPLRMLPPTMSRDERMTDVIDGVGTSGPATLARCLWDVKWCDAVLVNLLGAQKESIGTVMEIAWAVAFQKPIVIIDEPGSYHDHCMIRSSTPYVVDLFDDAIDILYKLFD